MLKKTYEETKLVTMPKLDLLVHNYELFKIKADESTKEMYTRIMI